MDVVSALSADPEKASKLAFKYSDLPIATGTDELTAVQPHPQSLVVGGVTCVRDMKGVELSEFKVNPMGSGVSC